MLLTSKEIGNICRCFRKKNGYRQRDVAKEVGYVSENVSQFENGRNDNSRIFLWYILHGLTIDDLMEYKYGK